LLESLLAISFASPENGVIMKIANALKLKGSVRSDIHLIVL